MTHYTVNGTTPTTASAVYTAPFTIATTTLLQFFSVDLAGNVEAVRSRTYTLPPATGVTLTAAPESPRTLGTDITFTAAASGGSGLYEYQFDYKPSTSATWITGQAYSTSATWTWHTINLAGAIYNVRVFARNVGSTATFEASSTLDYILVAPSGPSPPKHRR